MQTGMAVVLNSSGGDYESVEELLQCSIVLQPDSAYVGCVKPPLE